MCLKTNFKFYDTGGSKLMKYKFDWIIDRNNNSSAKYPCMDKRII
ncbi:MAG: hypothetical protein ACRDC3_10010 [Paraclostridium dentum]|nr:hypothetical protein [Paraclostridium bifermentans]